MITFLSKNNRLIIKADAHETAINLTPSILNSYKGFSMIDVSSINPATHIAITLNTSIVDASASNWITIRTTQGQVINLDSSVSRSGGRQIRIQGDGDVRLADGHYNQVTLDSNGSGSRAFGGTGNDYIRSIHASDTIFAGDGRDTITAFNGGDDYLHGGNGRDVINMGSDVLNGRDTINGGEGADDLNINVKSNGYYFDSRNYNITSIENIKFGGNHKGTHVKIDDSLIQTSEFNHITLKYNNNDISLDASGLDRDHIVRLNGSGEVTLIDGAFHRVGGTNFTDGVIVHGGNKSDYFRSYNDSDTFYGNEGDDIFADWQTTEGSDYFNGGKGDDEFQTNIDRFDASDTFEGGEGTRDVLRLGMNAGKPVSIDAAQQLANVSGVERIQFGGSNFTAEEVASTPIYFRITDALVASSSVENTLKISSNPFNLTLNTSNLLSDKVVLVEGSGVITLEEGSVNTTIVQTGDKEDGSTIYVGEKEGVVLDGTAFGDRFFLGAGINQVNGGAGDDMFFNIGKAAATIYGGEGDDTFYVIGNAAKMFGGEGNDVFIAQTDDIDLQAMYGEEGIDSLTLDPRDVVSDTSINWAKQGIETVIDGYLSANAQAQTAPTAVSLFGLVGDDSLSGSNFNDTLVGGAGEDDIIGNGGDDRIEGGQDNDTLQGGDGNDLIMGDEGEDFIAGNNGMDTLEGGAGDDTLHGNAGDDVINGGAGYNFAEGQSGNDTFILSLDDNGFTDIYGFELSGNNRDVIHIEGMSQGDRVEIVNSNMIAEFSNDFMITNLDALMSLAQSEATQLGEGSGAVILQNTSTGEALIAYDSNFADSQSDITLLGFLTYASANDTIALDNFI